LFHNRVLKLDHALTQLIRRM